MDKTGTLTKGAPEVTRVITTGAMDESRLLPLVAADEKESEHPLAAAVVAYSAERGLPGGLASRILTFPGTARSRTSRAVASWWATASSWRTMVSSFAAADRAWLNAA